MDESAVVGLALLYDLERDDGAYSKGMLALEGWEPCWAPTLLVPGKAKRAVYEATVRGWLQSLAISFVAGWLLIEPAFILLIWRRAASEWRSHSRGCARVARADAHSHAHLGMLFRSGGA